MNNSTFPTVIANDNGVLVADSKQDLKFLTFFDEVITQIFAQVLPILQSNEIKKIASYSFIKQSFLSEKQFMQLKGEQKVLLEKINQLLMRKGVLYRLEKDMNALRTQKFYCIPLISMELLNDLDKRLKEISKDCWNKYILDQASPQQAEAISDPLEILERYSDINKFVHNFNANLGKTDQNKIVAISILNSLRSVGWIGKNGNRIIPNVANISWVRKSLFFLSQCQDIEIKEQALRDLIDLLESDPIQMITAFDLIDLQEKLLREIQAHKAQNLNTKLQRLLIKAYATTLECILLHASAQHLNALEENFKHGLWDGADILEKFNIIKDPEIELWTQYAIQGAQRIKTEVPEWKKWVPRIMAIGSAIVQIGMLVEEPQLVFGVIDRVYNELAEAFSHFEWHKNWFEELMILRRLTRLSLYDINTFSKLTSVFQKKKIGDTDELVLYGAVSTLERAVINSPVRAVQEEGIKLLLQYMTMEKPKIRSRIVQAFTELLSGPEYLRNTIYVLLRILEASRAVPEDEIWREVRQLPSFISFLKNTTPLFMEEIPRKIYHSVIKFVLRRVGNIKGEKDTGGHSFITLICSSSNDRIVAPILSCLHSISSEFSQHDVHGCTPYHMGVREKSTSMIRNVHDAGTVDINAKESKNGDTALHVAARERHIDGVDLLIFFGADLNLVNIQGNNALHISVNSGSERISEKLLDRNIDKNSININGETPLNIGIRSDNVYLVRLLLSKGATIAENVNKITPLIFAARSGAEKVIIYLLENGHDKLSPLEVLEITWMITSDNPNKKASEDFCLYHLERMERDPEYAAAFCPFESVPRFDHTDALEFTKMVCNSYEVAPSSPDFLKIEEEDWIVDRFNNTRLIHLARSPEKLNQFIKLLQITMKYNDKNLFGLTALHNAVLYGNEGAVKALLSKEQINIDAKDIRGFTPLHLAAYRANPGMIELLLNRGANPNSENDYGDTPFLISSGNCLNRIPESILSVSTDPEMVSPSYNSIEILHCLLKAGADPKHLDFLGKNALHHAVENGSNGILEFLFNAYPDLTWNRNNRGLLPIEEAVILRVPLDINSLLKGKSLSILHDEFVAHTKNKLTLGNLLAMKNKHATLKELLEENPAFAYHVDSSPYRRTPLHSAALCGHGSVVDVYSELKLDLNACDSYGNTAAHLAALEEHPECLSKLMLADADTMLRNRDGRNPLHLAAVKNSLKCANLLSKEPSALREKDGNGDLPLHLACKFNRPEMAKYLLGIYPEGVHALDDDQNTPLHHACYSGSVKIARSLYQDGAHIEVKNIHGETPLMIAALYGHTRLVSYLISIGANISSQDIEKETALHKAAFRRCHPVVKVLLEADRRLIQPKHHFLVNLKDVDQETALFELPKMKNRSIQDTKTQIEVMLELLHAGADPLQRNERGETFLHLLCTHGLEEAFLRCIAYLWEHRKRRFFIINVTDYKKNTLLHTAAYNNQRFTAEALLEKKASLGAKNAEGETPFLSAVKAKHYRTARFFIENGAAIHIRNIRGESVIHTVLDQETLNHKSIDFLNWIIQQAPKLLYAMDEKDQTPLHILARRNHLDTLDMIMTHLPGNREKKELYLWKKTKAGKTARDIAADNNFEKLEMRIRTYSKDNL